MRLRRNSIRFLGLADLLRKFVASEKLVRNQLLPQSSTTVRVNGKTYSLSRLIGRGGQWNVFAAVDEDGNRVAVKRMRTDNKHACRDSPEKLRFCGHWSTQISFPSWPRGNFRGTTILSFVEEVAPWRCC